MRRRERTALDVLDECRAAVEARNENLVAFVHLDWDLAASVSRGVDDEVRAGRDPGPLAGVPFGVKDLEHCHGMPTSYGSLLHLGESPEGHDDPHVRRLRDMGAIPVGKTATSEFGVGQTTQTRAWGTTRNPWDPSRTPGGSSGGSAAAVAAGMVPFATGSDAAGSVRDPAGFTGLVGLKPSHGRIGRRSGGSDLSSLGVFTTTVRDAARLLDVLAGPEPTDKMSLPEPRVRYESVSQSSRLEGVRLTWSPDLDGHAPADPEVVEIARAAAEELAAGAGTSLSTDPLGVSNPAVIFRQLGNFSIYSTLREAGVWPDKMNELCDRTRQLGWTGASMSIEDLASADSDRKTLEQQLAVLFDRVDALLTPTCACEAFPAGGPIPDTVGGKDASLAGAEPFASIANVGWLPSVSVPAGLTRSGLPAGLMITGRRHSDDLVLSLARRYELRRPWTRLAPPCP